MEIFEIKDIRNCTIYNCQWSYPQEGGCRDATGIFRDGGMAQYCRVPSEQVSWIGGLVTCVCLFNRKCGIICFFFFCDCWDLVATMMPVISDQDNDAVVDVDDHLHQIGLWFSFAQ